jgi:hypothetical protein
MPPPSRTVDKDGRIAPAHEKRGIDAAKGLDAPNEEIG